MRRLMLSLFAIFPILTHASNVERQMGLAETALRAQVTALREVVLSAEMTGKIVALPLKEGQQVRKGDLLASFECDTQTSQLRKAKAQKDASENTLSGHKRMAELNAIGAIELENSRLEFVKSEADVEYLNAQLRRCHIFAPYKGVVSEISGNEQEFVQIGNPVIELIDLSSMQVEFIAPSAWVSWLKPKTKLAVKVDDTGVIYPIEVNLVGVKVDAVSQSIKVTARFTGEHAELKPGMSGEIILPNSI